MRAARSRPRPAAPAALPLPREAAGRLVRPLGGALRTVGRLVRRAPKEPQLQQPQTQQQVVEEAGGYVVVRDAYELLRPQQVAFDAAAAPAHAPLPVWAPAAAAAAGPPAAASAAVAPQSHAPLAQRSGAVHAAHAAPAAPAAPLAAATPLAFARHLSAATNGSAPLGTRMESLSWLLFSSGRAQAALPGPPADPSTWLAAPGGLDLLEQVYVVGGAVADLGVADTLYSGAAPASNGQRAVAALDFAALLTRYLGQHGVTLREGFVAELPHDWLQAKALHVGSCLETRCAVHRIVFERLVERVGLEGAAAGPWGAAPAATTIINNVSAAGGASAAHANAAATATPAQGGGGPLQAVLIGVVAVVGGAVRVFFGLILGAGGALAKFLALSALLTAARAAAAFIRGGSAGGAAAAGRLPLASLTHQQPQMQLAWQGAGGPAAAAAAPAAWIGGAGPAPAAGTSPQASTAQPINAQPGTSGGAADPPVASTSGAPQQPAAPAAGHGLGAAPAASSGAVLADALGNAGVRRHAALQEQRRRAFGPGLDSYDDDGW
ncbi:hypothetical protein Rsub_12666 [Raphidocelis subcapitata]|uniref:Uncharacterized protein n=1 Tax=Raphidocelis subcapitata TaxID=307507 RepID=A0A2V0PP94_9CHLO|nr:hypothetical protein Rsub_12666 [Raphidocelis subcapitata]|eukprot:GBF99973.1 hypothetical protein Rsub_12666 [Raphidocelis subcapitata]